MSVDYFKNEKFFLFRTKVSYQHLLFLTLLTLAFWSCNTSNPVEEVTQNEAPQLVWVSVTNETDTPISLKFQKGLNDTIQHRHLISKKTDTLVIPLMRNRLLTVENKASLSRDILVSPGDSLFINHTEEGCQVVSNRPDPFVEKLQSQFPSERSRLQDSLYDLLVFTDSAQKMMAKNDYARIMIYPIFFQEKFQKEHPEVLQQFWQESLAEVNGIITKMDNEIQQNKPMKISLKEDIQLHRLFLRMSFLTKNLDDRTYIKEFIQSPFFNEEFLIQSDFGEAYLFYFITQVILRGEENRTSNRVYLDYTKAYDLSDEHFEGPLLAKVKWFCLKRMVDSNESYETISAYASDYQNAFPDDTLFNQKFQENFLISQAARVQSKVGLHLLKEDGSNQMLTGLLNGLKGKVVYVDYWASWCAPCRQAMPSSIQLRNKLKDEEVAFFYFSIDNNQDSWKRASTADDISGYVHNYLVLNHEGSDMKRNLNMDAIPRYLIFDKAGNLVERNAPSPMGESLESLLMKYIGQ